MIPQLMVAGRLKELAPFSSFVLYLLCSQSTPLVLRCSGRYRCCCLGISFFLFFFKMASSEAFKRYIDTLRNKIDIFRAEVFYSPFIFLSLLEAWGWFLLALSWWSRRPKIRSFPNGYIIFSLSFVSSEIRRNVKNEWVYKIFSPSKYRV